MTKEEIMTLSQEGLELRATQLAEKAATAEAADLDALREEVGYLEERKAQLIEERKAAASAIVAGAGEVLAKKEEKKQMPTMEEIRASRAYEEAYANYVKTGDDREVRTLVTSGGGGGSNSVPVPSYLQERIETSWSESRLWSAIRRKVSVKGIMRVPYEDSATGAVIHSEGTERPQEESITFGTVTITPFMIKKYIQITDEVLSLQGREFLDYIYDEIEYRIIRAAEKAVVDAIIDSGEYGRSTVAEITAVTPTSVLEALATLTDGARNPVAIMNKSMFLAFMSLTDLQQRPIFNVIGENGRPAYYINGVPVIITDNIGPATVNGPDRFIVGDLDGLFVNLPNGDAVDVVYDPYSKAPDDLVVITGKLLLGVDVVKKNFFDIVTVAGE